MNITPHVPVLLPEILTALNIQQEGIYVDGTFGGGGHSRAILSLLGDKGQLLAFDRDPEAIESARTVNDPRFRITHSPFSELTVHLKSLGWGGKVNGILLDLGVSSPQLEKAGRGFSFLQEGPLDMRMDPTQGTPLANWLARAQTVEIADVLKIYGEERYARRIARAIVAAREQAPLQTTHQLAAIVAAAHPRWEKGKNPATRTFQALRIFINRELEQLQQILPQTLEALASGGRLAIISFHSLEDRIVKRFIRHCAHGNDPNLPLLPSPIPPTLRSLGKPIYPTAEEVAINTRARSAVLRVAERC